MRFWWAGIVLSLCACTSDRRPDSGRPADAAVDEDAAEETDGETAERDGSLIVAHDSGGPITCAVTCDCPQGLACMNGECRALGTPVWCCEKPGCPGGQQCLDPNEQPDVCEEVPDPRDAGVRPDRGPGRVGDYCESDQECDQSMGFTCWERFDPPFIWNYCTFPNCSQTVPCPSGSECIRFNLTPPVVGCMQTCVTETDCREDAFCFPIPGAGFSVCVPDCRDDFFDCSVRDGSRYCNPATGNFIPDCDVTPTHDQNAEIGDPCLNSTECATGDICLGEIAWGFQDGMCSRSCLGLPESTACPAGSTCRPLPAPNNAIGVCFSDCTNGFCPDRPAATCSSLDPSWPAPSCIPPAAP